MAYATTVPDDPDTHEDFKPTNKLENSVLSLRDVVEQVCMHDFMIELVTFV